MFSRYSFIDTDTDAAVAYRYPTDTDLPSRIHTDTATNTDTLLMFCTDSGLKTYTNADANKSILVLY